jgi:hypothetical protein
MLVQRIGLAALVDQGVTRARHGPIGGTKVLTVIGSMLAGGDGIDDTDVLRAGATADRRIERWIRAKCAHTAGMGPCAASIGPSWRADPPVRRCTGREPPSTRH